MADALFFVSQWSLEVEEGYDEDGAHPIEFYFTPLIDLSSGE